MSVNTRGREWNGLWCPSFPVRYGWGLFVARFPTWTDEDGDAGTPSPSRPSLFRAYFELRIKRVFFFANSTFAMFNYENSFYRNGNVNPTPRSHGHCAWCDVHVIRRLVRLVTDRTSLHVALSSRSQAELLHVALVRPVTGRTTQIYIRNYLANVIINRN